MIFFLIIMIVIVTIIIIRAQKYKECLKYILL